MSDDCVICQKHQGHGPLTGQFVGRSDGFRVYHAMTNEAGTAPLGWLFIESERHAPYLADLTEQEAAALGRLRSRLAAVMREVLGAEFVLTFVLGLGIAHFHEHVVPRMPGTPDDVAWHASTDALPSAGPAEVADLARRLTSALGLDDPPVAS